MAKSSEFSPVVARAELEVGLSWIPITTTSQVQDLLSRQVAEGQHLDFKAIYWSSDDKRQPGQEAAKDVAAFLNGLGGSILVGVAEEDDGRAKAVVNVGDASKRASELVGQLRAYLVPPGAAEHADAKVLMLDGKSVLAVNVRPWPHGVVAVRWGKSKEAWRFPVRQKDAAADLAWEEVLMRSDAGMRRTRLVLHELLARRENPVVRFGSEVSVRENGVRISLHAPPGLGHATADQLDEQVLVLQMMCDIPAGQLRGRVSRAWTSELSAQAARNAGTSTSIDIHSVIRSSPWLFNNLPGWNQPGQKVAIPLEIVRAAWRPSVGGGQIDLLLDAALVFDGTRWLVEPA